MAQWAIERPDVDFSPQGIIGRLSRLDDAVRAELRSVFAEYGISDGDFDVLATLRRSGAPYSLTPGDLAATTMVTSGAVTKRVDRLIDAGLVTREVSETDGRSRTVALTDAGRTLIEAAYVSHMANEHRLVAGLTFRERAELARLLEKWGRDLGV